MTDKIITLGQWEGDPTVLIADVDDGTMEGYLFSSGQWKPGYTEEAFSKAVELSEKEFGQMFPDVPPFKMPEQ